MKKRVLIIILFACLWGVSISLGQDYTILLNNYTPDKATKSKSLRKTTTKEIRELGKYFLIQFEEIPTEEQRKLLKSSGIELLDYIPNYAYIARKIDVKSRFAFKADLGIMVLEKFKAIYKLESRIVSKNIPSWAIPALGTINVHVVCFEKLDFNKLQFKNFGITKYKYIGNNIYELEIEESKLESFAEIEAVKWIELVKREKVLNNKNLKTLNRANIVTSSLSIGKNLQGEGVVIGEFDGGEIYEHEDLSSNIIVHSSHGYSDHATHVAGTIIGKGFIDPEITGIAPKATLHNWDFYHENPMTKADSAIKEQNLNIVTNSWSHAYSPYYCINQEPYTVYERLFDSVANVHPKTTILFSAGNYGSMCDGGYRTIAWSMKNVIVVGAVDNEENITVFSSKGPTLDGRILPHVVGMGAQVMSTTLLNRYELMDGTSMSTPGVSASLALLYEAYKKKNKDYPNSSLAKALLCNTAKDLGNTGPDYKYGFGRVDILKAIESVETGAFFEGFVSNRGKKNHSINVRKGVKELKITLVWNDKPAFNGAKVALINNLDLTITDPSGVKYYPFVLNPEEPNNDAVTCIDNINNIEQIVIKNPVAGAYTISVKGRLVQGAQEYSLTYYEDKENLKLVFPIGDELLVSGNKQFIRWNSNNEKDPIDLYLSSDNGASWKKIASKLNPKLRNYEYTIPKLATNRVKIKVVQAGVSSESKSFTITPVVDGMNLKPGFKSVKVTWDELKGAKSYDVYHIHKGKLKLLGNTSETSFDVSSLGTNEKHFFAVSAYVDGVKTSRNVAKGTKTKPKVDLRVKTIVNPLPGALLTEDEPVIIRVINEGAMTLNKGTKIPVSYSLNNAVAIEDVITLEKSVAENETFDYTFSKNAYLAIKKMYKFKFELSHPADTVLEKNNVFDYKIQHSDVVTSYPYVQSFDKLSSLKLVSRFDEPVYLGQAWDNDYLNDDFEWWPWSKNTYKGGTGPDFDHTSGKGKFLYTESFFLKGKKGTMNLLSPFFNVDDLELPLLSFWFHMYAKDLEMGTLFLDVFSVKENKWYKGVWSKSGNQGYKWQNALINISDYKDKGWIRLRFRVVTSADSHQNSIAIDDLELFEGNIYDLKIDRVEINPDGGLLGNQETIKINYSNIGGKDLPVGETIKFKYQINDKPVVEESFVVKEAIASGQKSVFEFKTKEDLSDITKRYVFDFEIRYLKDKRQKNNKITDKVVQSYVEPKSAVDVGYYYLGLYNFYLQGNYPELSIKNFHTLKTNTETKGYSSYTDKIATVFRGGEYSLAYQAIFATKIKGLNPVGQFIRVWIDYNNDGHFSESEVVSETDYRGVKYVTDKIIIPKNAKLGFTRVRVRTSVEREDLNGEGAADKDNKYGETEDYTINIIEKYKINLGMTEFIKKPKTFSDLSTKEDVVVNFKNTGLEAISKGTNMSFSLSVNGKVFTEKYVIDKTINVGDSLDYEFANKLDLSKKGRYIIKSWLSYSKDKDQYNDTLFLTVINLPKVEGVEYSNNFEGTTTTWFATATKNQTFWEKGTPTTKYINKAHSGVNAWATLLDTNYTSSTEAYLYSPVFDLSKEQYPMLEFWISHLSEPGFDGLALEGSTDGENWFKLGERTKGFYNSLNRSPNSLGRLIWSNYSQGWKKKWVLVHQFAGEEKVVFRFHFHSDDSQEYEGFCIDDFEIKNSLIHSTEKVVTEGFNIWPNPFNQGINIHIPDTKEKVIINVLDLSGKLVKTRVYKQGVQQQIHINLDDVQSGVYILKVIENQNVYSKKIIKN